MGPNYQNHKSSDYMAGVWQQVSSMMDGVLSVNNGSPYVVKLNPVKDISTAQTNPLPKTKCSRYDQQCEDIYKSTYQLAHCNIKTPERLPPKVEAQRGEMAYRKQMHTNPVRGLAIGVQTGVDRPGLKTVSSFHPDMLFSKPVYPTSVCFTDSLRKSSYLRKSNSADLLQRLMAYRHNKNFTKSSYHTRSMKSLRDIRNKSKESNKIDQSQQTYTRLKPSREYSTYHNDVKSKKRWLKRNRRFGVKDKLTLAYDYLKASRVHASEVRYLVDMKESIRNFVRQIVEDDSVPCPGLTERYNKHKKTRHGSKDESPSTSRDSTSTTQPKCGRCKFPLPVCDCKTKFPHLAKILSKEPTKLYQDPEKTKEMINDWLRNVYKDSIEFDTGKIVEDLTGLLSSAKDDNDAKKIIGKYVNTLPLWRRGGKDEHEAYKADIVNDLCDKVNAPVDHIENKDMLEEKSIDGKMKEEQKADTMKKEVNTLLNKIPGFSPVKDKEVVDSLMKKMTELKSQGLNDEQIQSQMNEDIQNAMNDIIERNGEYVDDKTKRELAQSLANTFTKERDSDEMGEPTDKKARKGWTRYNQAPYEFSPYQDSYSLSDDDEDGPKKRHKSQKSRKPDEFDLQISKWFENSPLISKKAPQGAENIEQLSYKLRKILDSNPNEKIAKQKMQNEIENWLDKRVKNTCEKEELAEELIGKIKSVPRKRISEDSSTSQKSGKRGFKLQRDKQRPEKTDKEINSDIKTWFENSPLASNQTPEDAKDIEQLSKKLKKIIDSNPNDTIAREKVEKEIQHFLEYKGVNKYEKDEMTEELLAQLNLFPRQSTPPALSPKNIENLKDYADELVSQIADEYGISPAEAKSIKDNIEEVLLDHALRGEDKNKTKALINSILANSNIPADVTQDLVEKFDDFANQMSYEATKGDTLQSVDGKSFNKGIGSRKGLATSTPRGSKDERYKDGKSKTVSPEIVKERRKSYVNKVKNKISDWIKDLPVDISSVGDETFKQTMIDNIAEDMLDRNKYLQLNPEAKKTDAEEAEHIKYQVFRWLNKVLDENDLAAIMPKIENLTDVIKDIHVPSVIEMPVEGETYSSKDSKNARDKYGRVKEPTTSKSNKYETPLTKKHAMDMLSPDFDEWYEHLPLEVGSTPKERTKTKATKEQIKTKLADTLYDADLNEKTITDNLPKEIDQLVKTLPLHTDDDKEIDYIENDLVKVLKKGQEKRETEKTFDKKLEKSINKVLESIDTSETGRPSFSVLKDQLVDAFVDLHFTGDESEFKDKDKYKSKINDVVTKFCKEYLKQDESKDTEKLKHDLFEAIRRVSTPEEAEIKKTILGKNINDWLSNADLHKSDLKLQKEVIPDLANRLHGFQKELENTPASTKAVVDNMKQGIETFLKTLPSENLSDSQVSLLANELIDKINDKDMLAQSRRLSMPPTALSNADINHLQKIRHRQSLTPSTKDASVNPSPMDTGSQTEMKSYPLQPGQMSPRVIVKEYFWDSAEYLHQISESADPRDELRDIRSFHRDTGSIRYPQSQQTDVIGNEQCIPQQTNYPRCGYLPSNKTPCMRIPCQQIPYQSQFPQQRKPLSNTNQETNVPKMSTTKDTGTEVPKQNTDEQLSQSPRNGQNQIKPEINMRKEQFLQQHGNLDGGTYDESMYNEMSYRTTPNRPGMSCRRQIFLPSCDRGPTCSKPRPLLRSMEGSEREQLCHYPTEDPCRSRNIAKECECRNKIIIPSRRKSPCKMHSSCNKPRTCHRCGESCPHPSFLYFRH